jgi:hypothetical protein
MSRIAHLNLMDRAATPPRGPGILQRLHRHFAGVETAMAGQARRAALPPDTLSDSGLTPDELTDAPSHDPALPFFMQAGFGRRDR